MKGIGVPRKFSVHIPDAQIADLKERLSRTRWPDELSGAGWDYGSNLGYTQELAHYWANEFDWREPEAQMNSYQNYKLQIDDIDVHFIHEQSSDPNAIPLIFTHGWPGSFLEVMKIIGQLTRRVLAFKQPFNAEEGKPSFHVVAPSLPGFGFSSAPKEPGFGVIKTADTWNKLMLALGYSKYAAQGGDVGSMVSCILGAKYPEHCKAVHLNYVPISFSFGLPPLSNPWILASYLNARLPIINRLPLLLSRQELSYLEDNNKVFRNERAYAMLQATKPQTIGYGLNDSPAGLLAYIIEKFRTWSDCDGNIEGPFSKLGLCANVSIYWFNANIASSFRMYYESQGPFSGDREVIKKMQVRVPVGVATFKKEILKTPRQWAARWLNIQHWTTYDKGGHFAALEVPDLLASDIIDFFSKHYSENES